MLGGKGFVSFNNPSAGTAYAFVRSGGTWSEQAQLTPTDPPVNAQFGFSVAVSGDTAVVGAIRDAANLKSGAAYVFDRVGGSWSEPAKLTALDAAEDDEFGYSVAVSGNTAVVGARGDGDKIGDMPGAAYVFVPGGETWVQQAKLTSIDSAAGDRFGQSVSVSGDTALVGADLNESPISNEGAAYLFVRTGVSWGLPDKLSAIDAATGDRFGYSVAVSGDTSVVGAILDDDAGSQSGSAYAFGPLGPDDIPPVITLLGESPINVEFGSDYFDAAATAHDNLDGDLTASIVIVDLVDTGVLGTTTVTYNVQDAAGNAAIEKTRTVIVVEANVDTTAPVLTLPANITAEATSASGAAVSFIVTASDAVDPSPTVSCSPASGATFGLGTTTVTCTATDASLNRSTGTFTVTVVDTTAPVLTLPANITAEATSASGAAVSFIVTASDAVDPSPTVSCSPASGATFGLGTTTVSCTATDASLNSSGGTFTVTVVDTTAPVLTLPANITAEATSASGAAVSFIVTASDAVDPSPTVSCSPASGATFGLGTTTVTCTATDDSLNRSTGTFTVTVVDTTVSWRLC